MINVPQRYTLFLTCNQKGVKNWGVWEQKSRKRELFEHHREFETDDNNGLVIIPIDDAAFGVCQHGTNTHSASFRLLSLPNIWHLGYLVNSLVYVGIKGAGKIQASDICQPLFLL